MARNENQKLKILHLLNLLNENSDEDNVLSMPQIIDSLKIEGIKAERKSIYNDFECLRNFGHDIICRKGQNSGYYIGERDFELAELKLLVDSVQSSKFITEKKTDKLIKKIEKLTSKNYGKELQRQVYVANRVKVTNETVYYNVDHLHKAITNNFKIAFKYYEFNLDKKRQFRNNGDDYIVSPYSLTFSDDNYYLISHYPKNDNLTHFRVDRMASIHLLEEKGEDIRKVMGQSFSIGEYLKKTFDMYGGEVERVSILCDNSMINVVIDKFGEDVQIHRNCDKTFIISVNVHKSPTFYAWVFTFGSKMKIVSPKNVVDEFKGMMDSVKGIY